MTKRTQLRIAIVDVAEAHTRLNTFHCVIGLLEGGTLPGGSQSADDTASTIIKLCKAESQRQLRLYDSACNRALIAAKETP